MQIYQMDKNHIKDIKFPAFIVKADNETGKWILDKGIPEISLINSCIRFLGKDKVFIDVGAHMGSYSIILSKYCKKVYAFEAQKDTFYQLCGAIALNKITNIEAHNYCVCFESRQYHQTYHPYHKTLYITSEDGGGSTFIEPSKFLRKEYINVAKLDDFCMSADPNEDKVGLIKIDVEGLEDEVIGGANQIIGRYHPAILFESNQDDQVRDDIYKFLCIRNYSITQTPQQSNMFLAIYNK